jgi:hypothetical protein
MNGARLRLFHLRCTRRQRSRWETRTDRPRLENRGDFEVDGKRRRGWGTIGGVCVRLSVRPGKAGKRQIILVFKVRVCLGDPRPLKVPFTNTPMVISGNSQICKSSWDLDLFHNDDAGADLSCHHFQNL